MDIVFAYITVPDHDTALRLARGAVDEGLAACANILPGMVSVYRWEGEIQTDREEVLILKTRKDLFRQLADWIGSRHPYEVPCVLQLPVTDGNEPYLRWLLEVTEAGNG